MRAEIGILADPAKQSPLDTLHLAEMCDAEGVDFLLVGGTRVPRGAVNGVLRLLNSRSGTPVGLFPGLDPPSESLAAGADFFLAPMLLGSDDPWFCGGWHRRALSAIRKFGLRPLPVGYLLIRDGRHVPIHEGRELAWINRRDSRAAADLAGVAEVTGQRAVYLEAGSGAEQPIPVDMIGEVRAAVNIPIVVGGGLRTPSQIESRVRTGAGVVVVGNAIQENPDSVYLSELVAAAHTSGGDSDNGPILGVSCMCNTHAMPRMGGSYD